MIKIRRYAEVIRFDIARTIAGRGRYWTTAYLVDGILVDTGCAHCAGEFIQALGGRKIRNIVNTHSHEDHIGANGDLQAMYPDLVIHAHPSALPVLSHPRRQQPLQLYRKLFWGWPKPSQGQALHEGASITTERFSFEVIHTPGHSDDHLCLYVPERGWLFSGDLFVGGRDRALREGYDIWGVIDSLKVVAQRPIRMLFPGCARVREEPQGALHAKIIYLEELGGKVLDLHQKGWSERAIARALCGGPMIVELFTFGHFSRRHLIRSYLTRHAWSGDP
jgi:glyoxylase-like metal-dependent hydrolase (beta-lactamase superfamily II)